MSDDVSIPNPGYRGRRAGRYGRSQSGMDPNTKRLLLFAGGLSGVLVCLIAASSYMNHRGTAVPVVTADPAPIKVKPENPGGMQIDAAENDVFSGGSDPSTARLAPPAETPNPNGLREAVTAKPPAVAAAVAPVPAVVPPAVAPPGRTATAKPAVAANTPAPAAAKPTASGHPASVQLAALTSEQAAKEAWEQMDRKMPGLLKGHQPVFSRVDHDGRTFWRVRATGFADVGQARGFCEQVHTKGGACSVADF